MNDIERWSWLLVLLVAIVETLAFRRRRAASLEHESCRLIANAMPQAVFTLAVDGETITFANRGFAERCGGRPSLDSWLASILPEDACRVRQTWHAALQEGVASQMEYRVGESWLLTNLVPYRDRAGAVSRWLASTTDITEVKRRQEELRDAQESAARAGLEKDKFLAVVSHELRTPLTPVTMALSYMVDNPLPPGETHDLLAMMRRNLDLECRLIDDLLDVMQILRGNLPLRWEIVDVHQVVAQSLVTCRADLDAAGLAVDSRSEAEHHFVNGDLGRLQQVFWILLKNAAKFAPRGTLSISSWNEEGDIVVEFRDTGIGITEEQMPRIFRAFEQGESGVIRQFGGLGLGLAIGKSVAQASGGDLEATSPGRHLGAVFRVRLPTIKPPDAVTARDLPDRPVRVLFVEDDPMTMKVVAGLLGKQGFLVDAAATVREALARRGDYDILVSDIGLPDGTGFEVARAIAGRFPSIALTGYGLDEDIQRAMEAGFDCHLTKPIDFDKLIESILGLVRKGE